MNNNIVMEEKMKKKLTGYPSVDNPQDSEYNFWAKHPIIPSVSVYDTIKMINMFYMDKEAIDCLDLSANYNKLFKDAVTISRALKELGVKKGQIVAISMPNFYQAVASFLACNRIGAVTTFLNPSAPKEEIDEYLNLFESPILINYDKTVEENKSHKDRTSVKYIITLNKENANNLELSTDYRLTKSDDLIDFNSLESIAKFQSKGIHINNGNDNSLILFTSGTTGKPKSVVLTNKNVIAAGLYSKNTSKVNAMDGERVLVCVPFMYPYGFSTSTLLTLMSSKTAVLAPNMSKDTIKYYMKKKPNIIFGSPALLDLIMKNIDKDQDLSSITSFVSGGDFLTPSHYSRAIDFFDEHGAHNVQISNGSGNAETVSCGTTQTGLEIRPDTVGRILVSTKAMVVDPETLEEKKYGEEGLLCVSGEHVFKEYFKEPKLTEEVKFMRDGREYFKTGSMGFIDETGYFTLTARESRFYIMSSLNKVYCDHVQNVLTSFDCIKDCAVVKVPDDDMLYVNKAYIVLDDKFDATDDTLEHIKELSSKPVNMYDGEVEQLKWYEIPTYVEFVSELPRKPGTEKVDYQLLEDDAKSKLGKDKVFVKKK